MSHQPHSVSSEDSAATNFNARIQTALASEQIRTNFRGAMDFLRDKRKQAFQEDQEWQSLSEFGKYVRQYCIAHLPNLLENLEQSLQENGIHVHWAEDAKSARDIILQLAQDKNAKHLIKGKSMASEEIGMNEHLARHNIQCLESDMGEFIVQLDQETPSHIIMPAIHKNKEQIADLFDRELGETREPDDVDGLIGLGRKVLREKFKQADIGVSGVNFAIADTGTLVLVENEGNGRLSTTAPSTHIAIMGIEKVIPNANLLPYLLKLLTRSATGQQITTYVNMISRPRQKNELDGPEEVHLVLLDNGRSTIAQDQDMQTTLACIRCGACMNHCPVYTRIGGHAYGTTYPGPIGQVVMPQLEGLDKHGDLVDACSLNGACGEVCPVGIDLPDLIRTLRTKKAKQRNSSIEPYIWRAWRAINSSRRLRGTLLRLGNIFTRPLNLLFPSWRKTRTLPKIAPKRLHELIQEQEVLGNDKALGDSKALSHRKALSDAKGEHQGN